MKKTKRFLSILISMLMLISLMPSAFASASQLPTEFGWSSTTPWVLEFKIVAGVTSYDMKIYKDGKEVSEHGSSYSGLEAGTVVTENFGRVMLDRGAGSYTVKFTNDEENVWSAETPAYNYSPSSSATPIVAPTDFKLEGNTVSWSHSGEGATGFDVSYFLMKETGEKYRLGANLPEKDERTEDIDDIDWIIDAFEMQMEILGLTTQNCALVTAVRAVPADIVNNKYSEYSDFIVLRGAQASATEVASGRAGDSANWKLYDNGLLEITGSGSIETFYGENNQPYFTSGGTKEDVTEIIIGDEIHKADTYVFADFNNVTKVTIGKGMENLNVQFMYGSSVSEAIIPANITSISEGAFSKCANLTKIYVYNPNCYIDESAFQGIASSVDFYGYTNTEAHDKAIEIGAYFVALDPSFKINGGAEETTDKNVTLSFDYNACTNFKQYKIGDGEYQDLINSNVNYTLDNTDGVQRLSVTFKNDYFERTAYSHITYNNKRKLTYKVLDTVYTEETTAGQMAWENVEVGCGADIPVPTTNPSVEGYVFAGWEGLPEDGKMPDGDLIVTAKMKPVTTISGTVTYEGTPVSGAQVTLPDWTTALTTDENGAFSASNYPCGDFVINVEYNGMKTSVNVSAKTAQTDLGEISVKELGTSTAITAPEVTAVTINDPEALISDEDKTYLETPGNTIVIETKANVQVSNSNISSEATANYSDYTAGGIFLDLTVAKVKGGESTEEVPVTEANALIEFNIEIPQTIQGKDEYIILREHNGTVDAISTARNADGEYLTVSGNTITLYAKKFSVYSMYAKDAAPVYYSGGGGVSLANFTISFNSNGGSKVEAVKVKRNEVLKAPAAPTKDGYTFAGWFTDEKCTNAYNFETKVTKRFTLYAKWEETKSVAKTIVLTIDSLDATIDGETVANDVAPIIVNERTMLPIRFVAEELGATVGWDPETKTATVTLGEIEIAIVIDSSEATVNGEVVALDSPAFIANERTYLPIRFIMEELGADVSWDGDTKTVTITK